MSVKQANLPIPASCRGRGWSLIIRQHKSVGFFPYLVLFHGFTHQPVPIYTTHLQNMFMGGGGGEMGLKFHYVIALQMFTVYILKVLTNEKRGGLKVVAFDRSPFKLFTLRFLNKSVHAGPIL
jgi:hypothetical protein